MKRTLLRFVFSLGISVVLAFAAIGVFPDAAYAAKESARYWGEIVLNWHHAQKVAPHRSLDDIKPPRTAKPPLPPYLDPDGYAVLRAWLHNRPVLVKEQVEPMGGMGGDICHRTPGTKVMQSAWSELDKNSSRWLRFLPSFGPDVFVVARPKRVNSPLASVEFSTVGFTRDRTKAVFYAWGRFGRRESVGPFFVGEKRNGTWQVHDAGCSVLLDLIEVGEQ